MKIALIEAFSTGSHRAWLEGVTKHSCHQVTPFSLPGRFWKWRMHGGAISLADQLEQSGLDFDLILCTDMMDLALFKGLLSARYRDIPTALYFHENQLTYPWSPDDADVAEKRDHHYAFINYSSALVADGVFFNSDFHRQSFLEELPVLLKQFPDFREERKVLELVKKCQTLTLGTDLSKFLSPLEEKSQVPTILWNHRWEYDKNPEEFFELLE
ncbi:MAG: DUF3524 domain-containing protein, partial [Halobacteriovoraceae bacterium]|nr:DUF3524 domain-containing protein [Halobacteriovoraceae bacterium]